MEVMDVGFKNLKSKYLSKDIVNIAVLTGYKNMQHKNTEEKMK